MPVITIEDAADVRVADYRSVLDADMAARQGLFIAEGRLVVRRLLTESSFTTRSVLVTEPALAALEETLARQPAVPAFLVAQDVMNRIAGFNIHRGCLAIGERPVPAAWLDVVQIANRKSQITNRKSQTSQIANVVVVLERIANADNVGGIFRNAAAFGAGAVLLDPISTDPLYRKAIRTSMGSSLIVPFARAAPWPEALVELRRRGFATVAMTPDAAARPLHDVVHDVRGRPAAIVLGHEGDGLTETALEACEYRARIQTTNAVDSLNVATAAAIALYKFGRAG